MLLPTLKKCLLATTITASLGAMLQGCDGSKPTNVEPTGSGSSNSEPVTSPDRQRLPNVVLILADDLGYADAGFQNISQDVVTPNINQIAQDGAIFTAGYVTAPVCGPSRTGMLTGRYQERFGYYSNTSAYTLTEDVVPGIPLGISTIGNHFQDAGYTTGFIGKYHDGDPKEYWPHNRGFDEFFGFNNGAAAYNVGSRNLDNAEETPNSSMWRNDQLANNFDEYLTDKFGMEAAEFIERHKNEPFFLYVPFNAIHGPLQAIEEDLARFEHINEPKRRLSVAMNYNMDKNVGRILAKLKENNLMEDTLIVFLSDNGGKPSGNYSYNHPLRGAKSELYEGGIRIPFSISWKGKIPAGQIIDDPVISLDILPTVLTAVGADVSSWDLDGIDLMPRLTGKVDKLDERFLYWDRVNKAAIRDNDWKMVKLVNKNTRYELYNISQDLSESHDLATTHPEQLERMKQAFYEWQEKNMAPQWGGNPEDFPYYNEDYRKGSH